MWAIWNYTVSRRGKNIYYSIRAVLAEKFPHIHANKLNHKIIFFSVSVNFAPGPSSGLFCFADFGSSLPFLVRGGKTEATINQLINIGQFIYSKSHFITEARLSTALHTNDCYLYMFVINLLKVIRLNINGNGLQ